MLAVLSYLILTSDPIKVEQKAVMVEGSTLSATVVSAYLSSIRIKVGLGKGFVGRTEPLEGIAKRYDALCGINGSFFDAYTNNPIKNPHHTLISNGRFLHLGTVGSVVGFDDQNQPRFGKIVWTIRGSRGGSEHWPDNWFAYWMNRYPTAQTVTLFNRDWGLTTGMTDGTSVVVDQGKVTDIGPGSKDIPKDGFVIYFRWVEQKLLDTFKVGQEVEYKIVPKDPDADDFWNHVQEGVGAGPILVKDGQVALNPEAEGFTEAKILKESAARSLLGVTQDGRILLVTTSGTMKQIAELMVSLGASDAMNLDGGASSCLWADGRYLRAPGRDISNALLLLHK